jgi:hypothetical protein
MTAISQTFGQIRLMESFFQRSSGPIPISTASGAISGIKTLLK